ncbi:MAG: monovalent cation/H+ antiporter subunit D family protein [Acidobacteriota bacterium]|nr:MAG: monovalent cation/H+ antiporter subunit D family protein [Acidobacteriota bacterium]
MSSSHAPILILLVPLATALFIPLLALWNGRGARTLTLLAMLASFFFSATCLWQSLQSGPIHYHLAGWAPPIGIELVLDPLSGFMATLVSGLALLAAFYSGPYFTGWTTGRVGTFYSVYCLLVVGLQGIVITGDLFNLYVFLEISSLAAYALLSKGGSRAIVAVFRYLLIGTVAASFYLIGVGYLYAMTGTLNMADMASRLPDAVDAPVLVVAASFIVIGLAIKAALFPLHGWLPDAYTYAPGPVIGFIAAVMTKVSAYALYRILYFVFDVAGGPREPIVLLGWASVIAVVAGSLMALAQKNVQRMLAYSSIGQMGYIMLGIAIGTPIALAGALLHVLNHAVMKGCLFMAVNGIQWKLGVFRVKDFNGMAARLPLTMAAFTVAALSMIGLPPTAGFFSKYYLVLAAIESGQWAFLVALVISSLLGAVYFFRVIERAYLMERDESASETRELPATMLGPILALAVFVVLLGVFNQTIVAEIISPGLPS